MDLPVQAYRLLQVGNRLRRQEPPTEVEAGDTEVEAALRAGRQGTGAATLLRHEQGCGEPGQRQTGEAGAAVQGPVLRADEGALDVRLDQPGEPPSGAVATRKGARREPVVPAR